MPNIQFQFRRGTVSEWTSANPTLAVGEMGVETDANRFKIGTGSTPWNTLGYSAGFAYKGSWSSGTSYVVNDVVSYNNSSYICISSTSSTTTPNLLTTNWSLLALAGTNGISFIWRGAWVSGTSYVANDVVSYTNSTYICISATSSTTTPDSLAGNWSVLVQSVSSTTVTILDDISGQFDGNQTHFQLKNDNTPINIQADSKDFEVVIDGRRLTPYITRRTYPWLTPYDSFKGFRVRQFIDSSKVSSNSNYMTIYNAPYIGDSASVILTTPTSNTQIMRYPFSTTTIAFGD
jgi:hypothetical protein